MQMSLPVLCGCGLHCLGTEHVMLCVLTVVWCLQAAAAGKKARRKAYSSKYGPLRHMPGSHKLDLQKQGNDGRTDADSDDPAPDTEHQVTTCCQVKQSRCLT